MLKFEKITLYLLFLLIAFPFNNIVVLQISAFNLTYQSFIHLLMMISIISFSAKNTYRKIEIIVALLFLIYLFFQIALSHNISQAFKHASIYSAFIIATLYLSIPIKANDKQIVKIIITASVISVIIALIMHFFFSDIVLAIKSKDENITEHTKNRLYWNGAIISLLILPLIIVYNIKRKELIFSIISIGVILVQNRTIFISYTALLILLFTFRKKINLSFKNIGIALSIPLIFFVIIISSENQIALILRERLFASDAYDVAFTDSRYLLYDVYFETLTNNFNFLFGKGLGQYVAVLGDYYAAYYTDVSFLTFFLPLGLLGFLFLSLFVWRFLFRVIKLNNKFIKYTMIITFLILILTSFNIDVFSRNDLVIVITVLLSSYTHYNILRA